MPTQSHNPRSLFDHLVGAKQDRWGYGKTKRLGGLEVYGHLKFCRELNGKLRRLRASQDAIDISGGTTKGVYPVDSVGEQTAVSDKLRKCIDRRYVVSGGRGYERRAMRDREQIANDDKAASRLAPKAEDGRFEFYLAMNGRNAW